MPPSDYAPYKRVMPPGGIASAVQDPYVQRYIAEQKAAREPWLSYIGSIASNMSNVAQGFLPTALGGGGMGEGS
jgi:hypothetical protein